MPPSATCNCSFEFQRTGVLSYHPAQCLAHSRGWGPNWQQPGTVLIGLGQSMTETEAECYEPYTFELFNLIPLKFYLKPRYNEGLLTYIATWIWLIAESDSVLTRNREALAHPSVSIRIAWVSHMGSFTYWKHLDVPYARTPVFCHLAAKLQIQNHAHLRQKSILGEESGHQYFL